MSYDPKRPIAVALARCHYEAFEWSGCDGSSWHQIPADARRQLIAQADEWRASLESAGYSIVPNEAMKQIQTAMQAVAVLNEGKTP